MSMPEPDRWQEIREIHNRYQFAYQIGGGLLLVLIGVFIGAVLFANDLGYPINLYTEVLGVIVTIFVLDRLAERREDKRRIRDLQERLVLGISSSSNEITKDALRILKRKQWLEGKNGILQGVDLSDANLQGLELFRANFYWAYLGATNFQSANLYGANLEITNLGSANFQEAIIERANLQRSSMWHTDLRKARLLAANLQEASLKGAHLEGANFNQANLQSADLQTSVFDETTILPDGTHWTQDTDLERFTDPNHPNFWRSDNPASPAYREK